MKHYTFTIKGRPFHVEVEESGASNLVVTVNGNRYTVSQVTPEIAQPKAEPVESRPPAPEKASVPAPPEPATAPAGNAEEVRAPLPGRILSLAVSAGARVRYGDALCTLEAMKMESVIRSPVAGVVAAVHVQEAASVQYNDLLVSITRAE